ncbi:MAG: hypothetical protein M3245_03540, partial [Actinomycetota bacterium]|nr:hypothetical protein [Actinomycetota bacterium]
EEGDGRVRQDRIGGWPVAIVDATIPSGERVSIVVWQWENLIVSLTFLDEAPARELAGEIIVRTAAPTPET